MKLNEENFVYFENFVLISGTGFVGFLNKDDLKKEIIVITVIDNSLAFNKNIKLGDKIIKINNKDVEKLELCEIIKPFVFNKLHSLTFEDKDVEFSKKELKEDYYVSSENFFEYIYENFDIEISNDFKLNFVLLNEVKKELEDFKKNSDNMKKYKKLIEHIKLKIKEQTIESELISNNNAVFSKKL